MAPHHGLENELDGDVPGAYPLSNVSAGSDGSQSSVLNAHQEDQFIDVTNELPQSIELDEDDAGTDVAGGLDFMLALRNQPPAENDWIPRLEGRAGHGRLEGSVMVEPSQGSLTVSSETEAGTNGNEDVLRNDRKPIASPSSCGFSPTNQEVAVPVQSETPDASDAIMGRINGSLKNVFLGVCFIIAIPTVVGVAVVFGTKSLISGTVVGCAILVILTAVFACLQVMWEDARVRAGEERQQRGDGPSNGP
ncbi:MAG: hypothetical protein M1840_001495 [Geoglossum simile]|nr:MAG: hypothetical protein M1840_001495 [Geoglossum simile]